MFSGGSFCCLIVFEGYGLCVFAAGMSWLIVSVWIYWCSWFYEWDLVVVVTVFGILCV